MGCRPEVSLPGKPLPVISGQVPPPGRWPSGCHFAKRCPLAKDDCSHPVAADVWSRANHVTRCLHVGENS